jgi:restriction system protein
MDRVLWAITYLRKSGLIESVSWGIFQITERGRELLEEQPKTIGLKDLERYPEYLEFKGKGRQGSSEKDVPTPQETPEEELQRLFGAARSRLENDLLEAFKELSPISFERVVLNSWWLWDMAGRSKTLRAPRRKRGTTVSMA